MASTLTEATGPVPAARRQAVALPLAPLAVLIGRNGSGKSNALDAPEVLSRLVKGTEVRDALDGTSLA
ncbi:MAG: AAA family ATPase [Pseudonocardiaceae bacterium]